MDEKLNWNFAWYAFLVLLTLRLVGLITWSWAWVTSPLWTVLAVVNGVALLLYAALSLKQFFDWLRARRLRRDWERIAAWDPSKESYASYAVRCLRQK